MLEITAAAAPGMLAYYLFAAFVFALICGAMVLWRFLFGQGFKKDRMYLEQKEEELKQMLSSLRKEADDFFDLAAAKTAEISDERKRVASLVAGFVLPQASEFVRPPELTAPEVKAVPISDFRKAIDDAARKQNEPTVTAPAAVQIVVPAAVEEKTAPEPEAPKAPSKREQIIAMLDDGSDAVQIAKVLGITRNEVDLVMRTR